MNAPVDDAKIFAIGRPHPNLWTYYILTCLVIPPLFPLLVLPMYFRYHTLRYTFTNEGVSMRWGILFRREIIINYARIQDIHLRSNIVERWLGLARVLIQTASGTSGAEMTLEGLQEFEAVRDFLYSRMRGVHEPARSSTHGTTTTPAAPDAELAATLREIAAEVRETRRLLEAETSSVSRDRRV